MAPSDSFPKTHQDLEELGDEAILAQETAAHLPQKRAHVTEEARSVVITEPQPGQHAFRHEPPEPTMVVRDRRELDAARRKILARREGTGRSQRVFWIALGVAVIAGVAAGIGGFLVLRGPSTAEQSFDTAAVSPPPVAEVPRARQSAAPAAKRAPAEHALPQVDIEQLPLERPKRRAQ